MAKSPKLLQKQEEIVVEFQNVSYGVGKSNLLFKINLTIPKGEVLVLLGRSGSGKTTTLKLINHLLIPTEGKVLVLGRATTDWDTIQLRRSIGYVIQEIGLFPHFTVEENVGLIPSLENWKPKTLKTRVHQLLHLVGLEPAKFANRYPQQLSGGQRQRVGIARALAIDPPILLMDEPFGGLDPITRLEMQQQLRYLQKQLGKTIIFVTHDIQEAFRLATKISLICEGESVLWGTPTEFKQSQHPEAKSFMACWQISN